MPLPGGKLHLATGLFIPFNYGAYPEREIACNEGEEDIC